MSWKSIVITGLLCIIASPVLAQPVISWANGGLDGGNQIWDVSIAPNPTGFVVDSSLAVELDLTFTSAVTNFAINDTFWNVGAVSNPGNNPFTQTMTETVIDGNTLFIAAGSELFADTDPVLLGSITTTGEGGTVEWGGLDTGAGFMSTRIAQQSTNYDGLTGSFPIGDPPGMKADLNDDDIVNGFDIDPFVLVLTDLPAYQGMFPGVDGVFRADINDDSVANGFDIDPFVLCVTNGGCLPGSGSAASMSVGGVAVPEPTSIFLCLGAAAIMALRRSGR